MTKTELEFPINMPAVQIIDQYCEWLRENISIIFDSNGFWCKITTPLLDRYNDHVEFYMHIGQQVSLTERRKVIVTTNMGKRTKEIKCLEDLHMFIHEIQEDPMFIHEIQGDPDGQNILPVTHFNSQGPLMEIIWNRSKRKVKGN